jgi:membrane protease YdiL (CAAX protease family)
MSMKSVSRQILVFILLVIVLSAIPDSLMVYRGNLRIGHALAVYAVMWCPALAAFITCALFRIDIATLGWNFRPVKYEWMGYFLPLVYAVPVYLVVWLAVDGSFAYAAFASAQAKDWSFPGSPGFATWALAVPLLATIGVIRSVSSALGEEIGWRGFLLPRLTTRFGFTLGCTVSGLIWAAWHYPGILWAGYDSEAPKLFALVCFTLMVVADAFVLGWLRLKSGSLWPCAILHASHNLFIQGILDQMTAQTGRSVYLTSEFGAGMVVTTALVAGWLWTRRSELPEAVAQ